MLNPVNNIFCDKAIGGARDIRERTTASGVGEKVNVDENRNRLESCKINCPYCGENFEVQVDCSVDSQQYIEDCYVCCQAIEFVVSFDLDNKLVLYAKRLDE